MDLRKILKYCPEGWKFYSTIFGDETCVSSIDQYEGNPCPITIYHSKLGKSASYKIARNDHPFVERCGDTIFETDAGAKYLDSKYTFDSLFINKQ